MEKMSFEKNERLTMLSAIEDMEQVELTCCDVGVWLSASTLENWKALLGLSLCLSSGLSVISKINECVYAPKDKYKNPQLPTRDLFKITKSYRQLK